MLCHNYNDKTLDPYLAIIVFTVTLLSSIHSISSTQNLILSCSEENGQWRPFLLFTKKGN